MKQDINSISQVLSGKKIAGQILERIAEEVNGYEHPPSAYAIIVGEDMGALAYARQKKKTAKKVGINFDIQQLDASITTEEIARYIKELGSDNQLDGIVIERPLPPHIDEYVVEQNLSPLVDVDAITPENLGLIMMGNARFYPATCAAVIKILEHYNIPIEGAHIVILGRSISVGKPLMNILSEKRNGRNGTVTLCHSKTRNLEKITRTADILIVAMGKPEAITARYISDGAIVIDIGTNYTEKGLVGDVHSESVFPKVKGLTPVPGGVGPVTVAMLLENVLSAHKMKKALSRRL